MLHDSTQSDHGGVCDKIEDIYNATGGRVEMDSAFWGGLVAGRSCLPVQLTKLAAQAVNFTARVTNGPTAITSFTVERKFNSSVLL
jgi:predicted component of type VI protein secretion system